MSLAAESRAQLEEVVAALTDCEVSKARIRNYVLAHCDAHGFDSAMEAVERAKGDLVEARPDMAADAGWGR